MSGSVSSFEFILFLLFEFFLFRLYFCPLSIKNFPVNSHMVIFLQYYQKPPGYLVIFSKVPLVFIEVSSLCRLMKEKLYTGGCSCLNSWILLMLS